MTDPASRKSPPKAPNPSSLRIALGLLLISLTLNVVSARRLSSLQKRMELQGDLQVGASMPPIVGLDSHGQPTRINYSDVKVPTVLYVFTPQCGWCKKNLPNFHALIDQAGTKYRIIGIALTRRDLDSYITTEALRLPVYADIRSDVSEAYRLGGTPETIVISPESKVLRVWHGAYQEGIQAEIEQFFRVHMPGCCQS
jgi:peroxiredoxin